MPEMRFHVRWPDESVEVCYSPSLVIKDHLAVSTTYPLADFRERGRIALTIAAERVREKYGFFCTRALGQLARIEEKARHFEAIPGAFVTIVSFEE
jgi:uncharacterized repeat protein (TIGR04042 family)